MMEPTSRYDAWEEKTRTRYKEGAKSRRLHAIAADPQTPAPALEAVATDAFRNFNSRSDFTTDACLVVLEALAANPNTPPHLFAELIWRSPFSCRAFCHNPVTPFLLLEQPGFIAGLMEQAQHALLREADALPIFVQMLADGNAAQNDAVRKAARLHVAFAGEAGSRDEWERELRNYWQSECAATQDKKAAQWHADLAEIGLAPQWAKNENLASQPKPFSPPPFFDEWFQFTYAPGSHRETALLKRFGPGEEYFPDLARGLRANATPDDLLNLFHKHGHDYLLVRQAILSHPSASPKVFEEIEATSRGRYQHLVAGHPNVPTKTLVRFLEGGNTHLRRWARRNPNAPPNACDISRRVALRCIASLASSYHGISPFVSFIGCLFSPYARHNLVEKAEHHHWTERLEAVFLADGGDEPIPGDPEKRTGRDLLHHLSRDGNRIVRAAAKTRLVAPAYRFSLTTPGDEATPPA